MYTTIRVQILDEVVYFLQGAITFGKGMNPIILSLFMDLSSYRAGSTDIPDPLSPLLPIVHRPR